MEIITAENTRTIPIPIKRVKISSPIQIAKIVAKNGSNAKINDARVDETNL